MVLSKDELWRIMEYCRLRSPPGVFRTGPDVSTVPGISLARQSGGNDDGGPSAGTSLALQTLYANDAVKHPLAHLIAFSKPLDPVPDYDSDSDSNWEDNITFLRYCAAGDPLLAKMVQEHERRVHEHLNQRIANWVEEVHSVTTS